MFIYIYIYRSIIIIIIIIILVVVVDQEDNNYFLNKNLQCNVINMLKNYAYPIGLKKRLISQIYISVCKLQISTAFITFAESVKAELVGLFAVFS
jgi:hypothetical protein